MVSKRPVNREGHIRAIKKERIKEIKIGQNQQKDTNEAKGIHILYQTLKDYKQNPLKTKQRATTKSKRNEKLYICIYIYSQGHLNDYKKWIMDSNK